MAPRLKFGLIAKTIFLAFIFQAQTSKSCLSILNGFRSELQTRAGVSGDLCSLADRYQRAKETLLRQGVQASMIAEVRAPRFVRVSHWEARKARFQSSEHEYDPRFMYDRPGQPEGSVWAGWNRAAQSVDTAALNYYQQLDRRQFRKIDFSMTIIQNLHGQAMGLAEANIAGLVRTAPLFGRAVDRRTAPTVLEAQVARTSGFPSFDSTGRPRGENIVRWVSTVCLDDLSADLRRQISSGREFRTDLLPHRVSPFTDENKVVRQCGYYAYPQVSEIHPQLAKLEEDVRVRIQNLIKANGRFNNQMDPLFIAARTQRWLVSIHPFNGGNGRTSRLMMDQILQSFGLPAPIVENVDGDLTTSDENWAVEIAKGIEKTISLVENCARNPRQSQCAVVPEGR